MSENRENLLQVATFAAGCFWGVEETFRKIKGVRSTAVGYTGGWLPNPTYEMVCTDRTGHAEAIEIHFDPSEVTYGQLLKTFFSIHNPTTLNRQGPDIGVQYRSAIFFHTPEQEAAAKKMIEQLDRSGKYRDKIVTQVVPASKFYRAEDYHQRYYEKRGGGSCYF
ncbi:MAG: peptide-methionine (S)-S-oxide reductase MsrA [Thermoproteota archaeon]